MGGWFNAGNNHSEGDKLSHLSFSDRIATFPTVFLCRGADRVRRSNFIVCDGEKKQKKTKTVCSRSNEYFPTRIPLFFFLSFCYSLKVLSEVLLCMLL